MSSPTEPDRHPIFSVWAPNADRVRLVLDDPDGGRVDLERADGGWFVPPADAPAPTPGRRYAFQLATEPAAEAPEPEWSILLPDPRSRRQPDGVHGFSEVVPTEFDWTDAAWTGRPLPGQVLYELHVGAFTADGTFDAAVGKLAHLRELGVTTVELMPVQPFGGERNWGYDPVSWFAVHEAYGGPAGLKAFVDAAHAHGVAVVMDLVFNHFGPDGNYTGFFGPYTTGAATDWGDVVNLMGPGSDEVRRFILDATRQWLGEFHVDGVRLDAVHSLDDRGAVSVLEQIADVARDVAACTGAPRCVIAESDLNDPRLITPVEDLGCGLDAQWLDDVHHCLHTLTEGEQYGYYRDYGRVGDLARTLSEAYRFTGDYSLHRGRSHGRGFDRTRMPGARFVTYTTTHDQTGNRAAGDRAAERITPTQHLLKCAFVYLSEFTPMIFMGEEFGARQPFPFFASHTDPGLLEATRTGRLREFASSGWDPDTIADPAAEETFASAKLDWELDDAQRGIVAAVRELLRLRRELGCASGVLSDVRVDHAVTAAVREAGSGAAVGADAVALEHGWVTMHRTAPDGREWTLVGNFSPEPVTVPFGGELRYSFTEPEVGADETRLGPWEFAVLLR